ncbi:MAG: NADP-dependent oxidoreductase domain-containing protein [Benjaminiella poitrasii]|nr:MAG: NADP-dependent oxidoreductase domain-containing protein [Benjaminiella poitrasii]
MSSKVEKSLPNMQYVRLVKDDEGSLETIGKAHEAVINFFDTADAYSKRQSERNLLTRFGLSRKHIFDATDASLKRLDLDYIDLYQIHRKNCSTNTPIEETMEALSELVCSGKVGCIGASSMSTWEFQKANAIAARNGWTQFVSMQNCYDLLYREEEREMFPYCLDSIPWSPLAKGVLDRQDESEKIIDRIIEVADKLPCPRMLTKSHCTAPIVGISSERTLYDTIGAPEIKLSKDDVKYLEEPYVSRSVVM